MFNLERIEKNEHDHHDRIKGNKHRKDGKESGLS